MNIPLFISASSSEESINRQTIQKLKDSGFDCFDYLDLREYSHKIPMLLEYHSDLQICEPIKELFKNIEPYKLIVFFAPEHNRYLSAFLKNILDWLSLLNKEFLLNKNVIFVSASNTYKEKRLGEESIFNTFQIFVPKRFVFINLNNYSSKPQELNEKIVNLKSVILEFLSKDC